MLTYALIEALIKRLSTPENLVPRIIAMLVPTAYNISVCGDLHGQFRSLASIEYGMHQEHMIGDDLKLAPENLFVPLGDYADRVDSGGVEVWHHLALLNQINDTAVIPLAGNHENIGMASRDGFLSEWTTRLAPYMEAHYSKLHALFSTLPQALLVGFKHTSAPYYRFLLICHAGIEQKIDIAKLMTHIVKTHQDKNILPVAESIPIDQSHRNSGLLWNDFVANDSELSPAISFPSGRGGSSRAYNSAAAKMYMQSQHIDIPAEESCCLDGIICAHAHFPYGLARLKKYIQKGQHWDPITPGTDCQIMPGDVFTCNASNVSSFENR